jgi:hypothetical protein
MAAKDVVFSQSARRRIAHGLDVLANTVKLTLGPRDKVKHGKGGLGFNAATLAYEDLVEAGAERRNDAADVDATGS